MIKTIKPIKCRVNCEDCKDSDCKSIEIKSFHKIKWTRELKFAMKKIFDDEDKNRSFAKTIP